MLADRRRLSVRARQGRQHFHRRRILAVVIILQARVLAQVDYVAGFAIRRNVGYLRLQVGLLPLCLRFLVFLALLALLLRLLRGLNVLLRQLPELFILVAAHLLERHVFQTSYLLLLELFFGLVVAAHSGLVAGGRRGGDDDANGHSDYY